MMSAVLLGAGADTEVSAGGDSPTDGTGTPGDSLLVADSGDAAFAALARIFERMSFVEGFGSVI